VLFKKKGRQFLAHAFDLEVGNPVVHDQGFAGDNPQHVFDQELVGRTDFAARLGKFFNRQEKDLAAGIGDDHIGPGADPGKSSHLTNQFSRAKGAHDQAVACIIFLLDHDLALENHAEGILGIANPAKDVILGKCSDDRMEARHHVENIRRLQPFENPAASQYGQPFLNHESTFFFVAMATASLCPL